MRGLASASAIDRTRGHRLTVPRIHVKHLLDEHQLHLPELVAPCFCLFRPERDGLETPFPVIPYPVHLRMDLQVGRRETEIRCQELDLFVWASVLSNLHAWRDSAGH